MGGQSPPKSLQISGGDRDTIWRQNQRVLACYRAQTFAMACDDGRDAMDLLVRSARIQGDMKSYAVDEEYAQQFQLIVRDFVFFDVSLEFRSFVYKGKLTALTQYNDLCYFADLFNFEASIVKKIQAFVDEILQRIEMDSLVLDLVLVDANYDVEKEWPSMSEDRLSKLKVMVIEINPLAEFAGGGLFEWNKDKDVLLGEKPFEFRMRKSLSSFMMADLMPAWHPFVFGDEKKLTK